jgi:hypothetical protein
MQLAATAVAMLHAQLRAAIFTLRLLTVDLRSYLKGDAAAPSPSRCAQFPILPVVQPRADVVTQFCEEIVSELLIILAGYSLTRVSSLC